MRHLPALAAVVAISVSACARTDVTPVSQSAFMINTAAAPICGGRGAVKVASKMAAVEVLRRGYTHYILTGAQSQNNITSTPGMVFGATTYSNPYSNMSTTTINQTGPIIMGTHDRELMVQMIRPDDPRFPEALDARTVLGADWQKLVAKGIKTC